MANLQRGKYLKKARTLQGYNFAYDLLEVGISLTAGFSTGSAALIGWGLDSVVEVISAGTLWWRLNGEIKGISAEKIKRREKITLYVIAGSFLSISIFIIYDSITKLIGREVPEWSNLGLFILIASLLVNPIFIWYKYHYGKKLSSRELIADSKDTFICLYQTVAVLGGLLAVFYLDWWWADPVAALLIVPYALYEFVVVFKQGRQKVPEIKS